MTSTWHSHSEPYNFVSENPAGLDVASTEGCYLIRANGEKVLDAAGGAIVVNVGHGRRDIAEAYASCVTETGYVVPPFATRARVELVERMRRNWLPGGIRRVAFASGGSEAMEMAMRLALQHHIAAGAPERWRILGRELSYHGTTMGTLAVGDHAPRRRGFEPWLIDERTSQPRPVTHYCYRCPIGASYPECGVACADDIEKVFEQVGPESVAALVLEPIVGSNAGALVPPGDYLPRVAEACRRHGVLLIADEVMTGYGRTGTKFGVDHWNVEPDILVGGKGLTSGYAPLGAVCASDAVLEPLAARNEAVMYYTYGGHSAACAAADRVLQILEEEDLVERARTMGARLREALEPLEQHPHIGEIRGRGLLYGIEIVADRDTRETFTEEDRICSKVTAAGIERGVFFYPGGNPPARDVVCLGPPFILGDEEIEKIATVLPQAIDAAVASTK